MISFTGSFDFTITVYRSFLFFMRSGTPPTWSFTLIFPSPPAGISFRERRTGVQPHPALTRSILSVPDPLLRKTNSQLCSVFSGTSPKSYSSFSNSMDGREKKNAVEKMTASAATQTVEWIRGCYCTRAFHRPVPPLEKHAKDISADGRHDDHQRAEYDRLLRANIVADHEHVR